MLLGCVSISLLRTKYVKNGKRKMFCTKNDEFDEFSQSSRSLLAKVCPSEQSCVGGQRLGSLCLETIPVYLPQKLIMST